jgi:hypothetical protein
LSEAKPLRWSFLVTFPIVLLATWVVISVFAHSQRARLVDELAIRIARGTEKEAKSALRQMVHMPDPPLDAFSAAAASPSRSVARQAQDSIGELLRSWQGQLAANRNRGRIAARLERLAQELDSQRDSISTLDYPWLARTTEKILRLANSAPPESALDLAMHCESLLATAGARQFDIRREIMPVASATLNAAPDEIFSPPSRLALESIVPDDAAAEMGMQDIESAASASDSATIAPAPPHRFDRPYHTMSKLKVASPIPVEAALSAVPTSPDPWAAIESRALLERWLATTSTKRQPIERELERRGFGRLRADVVRLALSNDTAGRVLLVHDFFEMPGVGAKPWLLVLVDDKDAEVRLAAVTVMSMSNDSQLLEKAWQVALHDQDPRIADLAPRLRDRRSASQRR